MGIRTALFACLATLSFMALDRVSLNTDRVLLSRWGERLSGDTKLRRTLEENCSVIIGEEQSDFEATFLRALGPKQPSDHVMRCSLRVAARGRTRFKLVSQWVITVAVERLESPFRLERSFPFSFPLPLSIFPFMLWGLSLSLGLTGIAFLPATLLSLFLSCGANPVDSTRVLWETGSTLMLAEKNFLSLCALLLWSLLVSNARQSANATWPKWIGRITAAWNPASLGGLFPLQYSVRELPASLWEQSLLACISAYFLGEPWRQFPNLTLPRYFTAATLLLVGFRWWRHPFAETRINRGLLLRSVVSVGVVEAIGLFVREIREVDLFMRVTLAMNVGCLLTPFAYEWKKVFRSLLLLKWLCFGLFVSSFSTASGLSHLILEWFNPIYHPHGIAHFTYVAGIAMGMISGSFSYSYFSLLPLIAKYQGSTLVTAALIDGVTAGTLLSPFHPLTCLSAGFFETTFRDAYRTRLNILLPPVCVGGFIYALGTMQSFSILLPMTFFFVCLTIGAYRLRMNRWSFS